MSNKTIYGDNGFQDFDYKTCIYFSEKNEVVEPLKIIRQILASANNGKKVQYISRDLEQDFILYKLLIEKGAYDLVDRSGIVSIICNREGETLLRRVAKDACIDGVKFMVNELHCPVNVMDNFDLDSLLKSFIDSIYPAKEEKLLEKMQILTFLLEKGALAYSCNCYGYADNPDIENFSPEAIVKSNMFNETIETIGVFMTKLILALGTSVDKDAEITTAISELARFGFLYSISDQDLPMFDKYHLEDLFFESGDEKQPRNVLEMQNGINSAYLSQYYEEANERIIHANIVGGFLAPEYIENLEATCAYIEETYNVNVAPLDFLTGEIEDKINACSNLDYGDKVALANLCDSKLVSRENCLYDLEGLVKLRDNGDMSENAEFIEAVASAENYMLLFKAVQMRQRSVEAEIEELLATNDSDNN